MLALVAFAVFVAQQSAAGQAKPSPLQGTFDEPSQSLHSAGVRGTIDAGGYSASAAAKTRTGFYEQLTDLQVAALHSAWAPGNPCAAANRLRRSAVALLAGGEFPSAATALETLLRTNDEPATRQLLGLAYEGTGQLEAAAEQFRTAATLRADDADLFAQGASLLFEGNVDRAETVFRRASRSSEPAALVRLGLGAALFQRGQVNEALSLFLDSASARPAEMSAFGFIAIAVGSAEPAAINHSIAILTSLIRQFPRSAGAHFALACALSAANRGSADVSAAAGIAARLKQAIALDPQLADAHFRLGGLYADREDLPPAIAEYRAAIDCNPRFVEAHYRLGQLYTRNGEPQLASEQLELHRKLRAVQKSEIESGKIPIHLPGVESPSPCRQ